MLGSYEKFTANTGIGNVATANAKLDGNGTMTTLFTAAGNGSLIKTVTIKAQVSVGAGDIIRLFVTSDGTTKYLLQEILFRPTGGGPASVFATAQMVVPLGFPLKSGYSLLGSTDVAKKFSIEVEGLDWEYP